MYMYRLHLAMNGVQTLVVIGTDYTAVPYDHNHDMYINAKYKDLTTI
jgi:hypothetical protein